MPATAATAATITATKRLFIHGLTGGIATGKTHACTILQHLGAKVINADTVAHTCYAPGTAANTQIRQAFGPHIFSTHDGGLTVDRAKLGKIVFDDPHQLKILNEIMFPAIETQVQKQIIHLQNEGKTKWVVVEAALLLEGGWDKWMDEVWCMLIEKQLAKERLMERNGFSAAEAEKRIMAQMSNDERKRRCRVTIDSSGTKQETAAKLAAEVEELKKRVKSKHGFDLV